MVQPTHNSVISPTGLKRPEDRGPLGVTGLAKARDLVKEILDQVTLHDCPPMNDNILLSTINSSNNQSQSKRSGDSFQPSKSNSSTSIANSTLTGASASNSLPGLYGNRIPRPFSRQRHVLPTILSPSATPFGAKSNNDEENMKHNIRPLSLDTQRFSSSVGVDPSPTSADIGDNCFYNTLSSPSFANSHIEPGSSEGIDLFDNMKDIGNSDIMVSLPAQVSVNDGVFTSTKLPPPPPPALYKNLQPGHGAEVIMGNLSLAALCMRTLESVSLEFDLQLPNPLITSREKDVSMSMRDAESKEEHVSSWQREVEMASTFTSDERNEIKEVKEELGSSKRKLFLTSLDDDDDACLFSDAKESIDLLDTYQLDTGDSLLSSQYEIDTTNESKTTNIDGNIRQSKPAMFLSAVEEGDEENESTPKFSAATMSVFEPSLTAARAAENELGFDTNEHGSLSPDSKLTLSPEQAPHKPRIQMFGSEYARHLSSESPFSPMVPKMKQPKQKKNRKIASSSSVAAASFISDGGSLSPTSQASSSVATNLRGGNIPEGFQRSTNYSVSTISTNNSHGSSSSQSMVLEDASDDILSAAITDIVVTHGKEMPPRGYYRIAHTSNCTQMDTLKQMSTGNKGVLGRKKFSSVHLNVKKEPKWDRAVQRPCVTAITVIFPDRNEFVPPGFCVVRKHEAAVLQSDKRGIDKKTNGAEKDKEKEEDKVSTTEPANLNFGTTGERVYLCYRRSREGNPITGLIPLQPSSNEAIPEGYTVIERSPRNFIADINSKAGPAVFLAYRQRLANLETLRPLPLVLSIHCAQNFPTPKSKNRKRKGRRLQSYYCTGGTVVQAEVGKYHIMDRSTHPLISPSSVTNRLTLIHNSRIKRTASVTDASYSTDTQSIHTGLTTEPDQTSTSQANQNEYVSASSQTYTSTKDSIVNGIMNLVTTINPNNEGNRSPDAGTLNEDGYALDEFDDSYSISSSAKSSVFVSKDDFDLQACFDAMVFIPQIQAPGRSSLKQSDEQDMNTVLQARIAIITPILTACYTQHGCSSLLVVEGLTKLINETDFFLQDISSYEDPESNERLTLLDLSIQVVCDMATGTARETIFLPCIEFVSQAFYYAEGNLNTRTTGYIIRFYLFVFYFGASVPTASCWPRNKTSGISRKSSLNEANDVMLLSEDELQGKDYRQGYVPGGAPQAGALALKELITIFQSRFRKMNSVLKTNPLEQGSSASVEATISDYVASVIDGAVQQVDMANFTQLALHQIHRSGGSELFWHDMLTSCGSGLFAQDQTATKGVRNFFISSFSILASLVKIASSKVRKLPKSIEPVPRDVASKLLSMELLHHFLTEWGKSLKSIESKMAKGQKNSKQSSKKQLDDIQSISTIAYNIRRLVVPCLLSNTRPGLEDIKVFRRMMKIVTVIWCNQHIRRHMKIEIGVLIEHFVLKFLRLGPQVLPPKRLSKTSSSIFNDLPVALLPQQVCVVNEVKEWFQAEPRDILELFLNFDQVDAHSSNKKFHLLPSTHWKITQQLCGSICALAEQCTDIVSEQIRFTRIDLAGMESPSTGSKNSIQFRSAGDLREMTYVREGARYLREKCFDTIGQITRSIMLCAAASSGANHDLLLKLREKQNQDQRLRKNISIGKENTRRIADDSRSESSMESDGNMTIKSISTISNIVGGILNKKNTIDSTDQPDSLRNSKQMPPSTSNSDGDIVEYWQTSIAAERRKHSNTNVPSNIETPISIPKKKPPRTRRIGSRNPNMTATPPRMTKISSSSPSHRSPSTRSPRFTDDVSILSIAEDSIRGDPNFSQKLEETLNVAFEIMQEKSLKKAFDYLIACNFLTPSPKDIASFLRLYQSRIDTATLGEFLGEGGKDGDETEHFNLIRFHYVTAISFVGMNVEQGLRHFLTNCGFRLPGEAQRIDRVMTTFSQCYWEDNAGDHGRCPFRDEDTVFLLSFAIIMLNTDLHKTSMFAAPKGQSAPKQKQRKKMTKPEFLNNLRGVDNSEDLSKEYLSTIYDSIAANPIAIYRTNENTSFLEGSHGEKTIKFSSNEFGHIIQGNIDLAGMMKHLIKNVKLSQELLRGLASHEHPYLTLRNRKNTKRTRKHVVPEDLVRSAFCSTWHHFHGTINSALDSAHLDPKGLENCLDVLMYSLCATICLDLTVERNAFASQLVRVKYFRENRGLEEEESKSSKRKGTRLRDHLDFKHDSWFLKIEKAAESYHENAKVAALNVVDTMFKKLHASLQVDSTLKKQMIKIARKILNGQILLNDPTRYFLKEGELAKRCNRTGRNTKYTFFLFSDVLVYARKDGGMHKIHGELPLHLMKIMDLSNAMNEKKSKHTRSFHLIHPRKSFVVFAKSSEEKLTWLDTINAAIGREVKRKARIEGARQASAAFIER